MSSHINLIASIVIGATLFLAILNMNSIMNSRSNELFLDNLVREKTVAISEIIKFDFNKIGSGIRSPNIVFDSFDSTSICFFSDIDRDGVSDTVYYSLSDVNQAIGTSNPKDRYLYRQFNNGPLVDIGLGITDFTLKYYNKMGTETTVSSTIVTIGIQMTVESTMSCILDDSVYYAQNHWQTKISPPNLLK